MEPDDPRPITSLTGGASTADLAALSPDVQLLYKSKGLGDKDIAHLRTVLAYLSDDEHEWLRAALGMVSPHHPWIAEL